MEVSRAQVAKMINQKTVWRLQELVDQYQDAVRAAIHGLLYLQQSDR